MREDYYAEYAVFEEKNWWFVSRRTILRSVLRKHLPAQNERRILDAGCGTGINLHLLREFGAVEGVDFSEKAIEFCQARGESAMRTADIRCLPHEDGSFDLVTALDVLEHIEEDRDALRELVRVCRPGGYVLLTVPSFPSLWGDHDVVNQHVRRYRPAAFFSMVEAGGLQVVHRSGMNLFLLPIAFLWRTYRNWFRREPVTPESPRPDNMHSHPAINAILRAVFTAESPLIAGPGLPLGLSILCLAKKL